MKKGKYYIWPSMIWIIILVAFLVLAVVLSMTMFTVDELRARGAITGYGRAMFAPIWIVISLGLLLIEVRAITVFDDHILVYNIFGFKRRLEKSKIKCIQFVKQKGVYYMLIILSDHETFGGYNQKVLSFAYSSPIKVVHLVISSKKWEWYYDLVSKYYSNISFLNYDKASRIK